MKMTIGKLPNGAKNCITDVADVRVGHVTLDEALANGDYACTGVTAILPHGGNVFQQKVVGASYVLNGFGKTTGLVQVNELGQIESPIMLTNTFSVPAVTQGTLHYMLAQNEDIGDTTGTINLVVGECNDSSLNSIRACAVEPKHAVQAIEAASTAAAANGAVGAGKGMICFGYKGGIGTASKIVEHDAQSYTVGCLVQTNFGSKEEFDPSRYEAKSPETAESMKPTDGSIIIVIATDAPLTHRQLQRMIKRAGIGLGRTGSHFSHGSGDIVIGFSTAHTINHYDKGLQTMNVLRDDDPIFNQLFQAVAEATESAIIQSLYYAETTTGRNGRVVEAYNFAVGDALANV